MTRLLAIAAVIAGFDLIATYADGPVFLLGVTLTALGLLHLTNPTHRKDHQ